MGLLISWDMLRVYLYFIMKACSSGEEEKPRSQIITRSIITVCKF